MDKTQIKSKLQGVLKDKYLVEKVFDWHKSNTFVFIKGLLQTFTELEFHFELLGEIKAEILTNIEFLKTYQIRQNGLATLPKDWLNPHTKLPNEQVLEKLWEEPSEGYLVQILKKKNQLDLIEDFKAGKIDYKTFDDTAQERLKTRLEKLQNSIDNHKIVIFLGRQNRVYKNLQNKLNEKYRGKFQFVSDHIWGSRGYTEVGIQVSDNRLSLIQACETIRKLPSLGLKGDYIKGRFIMFSLDSYDAKACLSAMYSNPNRVERRYPKPKIKGIEKFDFAYTGLTDLELANIVRNKSWFDLTRFCRTDNQGNLEELSKKQVLEEYGIKLITQKL